MFPSFSDTSTASEIEKVLLAWFTTIDSTLLHFNLFCKTICLEIKFIVLAVSRIQDNFISLLFSISISVPFKRNCQIFC